MGRLGIIRYSRCARILALSGVAALSGVIFSSSPLMRTSSSLSAAALSILNSPPRGRGTNDCIRSPGRRPGRHSASAADRPTIADSGDCSPACGEGDKLAGDRISDTGLAHALYRREPPSPRMWRPAGRCGKAGSSRVRVGLRRTGLNEVLTEADFSHSRRDMTDKAFVPNRP
jgi:hypothetical protein